MGMERAVLELLEEHRNMALAACDAHGTLILQTRALDRMLGGSPIQTIEDAGALRFFDATEDRLLGSDELPIARALRGEAVIDAVLRLHKPDGDALYLRCNGGPLRSADGQIRGAITLVQDITFEWVADRKQRELRDRLVTTVSHELRTPLTKIIGHAELLLDAAEDGDLSAPVEHSVRAVARASHDLARMAEKLTHLAELDDVTRIQPAPTDLAGLVRTVVDSEAEFAMMRDVRLRTSAPRVMNAVLDARSVSRGVHELIRNAICHAPSRSTVDVELCGLDGHLEICVVDAGPGIPVSERHRLTQPFERGLHHAAVSSSPGLGLAVAGAVAAAHGGNLALEDNEPSGLRARLRLKRVVV